MQSSSSVPKKQQATPFEASCHRLSERATRATQMREAASGAQEHMRRVLVRRFFAGAKT